MQRIAALVLLVLIPASISWAVDETYTPLSDDEARSYINSLSMDELIDEIQKLDAIEWSYPGITIPSAVGVYTANTLTVTYPDPWRIEVAGHLEYAIRVEPVTFDLPAPPPFPWKAIGISTGSALVLGFALGLIVSR